MAIASGANQIITFNLKDFPQSILYVYKIEVSHPDDLEIVRSCLRYVLIVLMRYNVGN